VILALEILVVGLDLSGHDNNCEDRISGGPISVGLIFAERTSAARILACRDAQNGPARRRLASCYMKVRRSWFKLPRNL